MEIKPGAQTTEFYGKLAVQAMIVVAGHFHRGITEAQATAAIVALEGIYIAARSILKAVQGAVPAIAELVKALKTTTPPVA